MLVSGILSNGIVKQESYQGLPAAFFADAADFGARYGDLDAAVFGNLLHESLVKFAFEFAYFAATEAGHVDVIARAVALVIVAIAAE
ncbi:MAG: hypothetical protein WAK91_16620, partial [Candidatus Acidiferrales bacterium]